MLRKLMICFLCCPLAHISHKILDEGGQGVASDLSAMGREHCPSDKARPIGGEDGVTDCSDSSRVCEKCGLVGILNGECISPWYFRTGIGLNFLTDDIRYFDFTFSPGLVVSGALGYECAGYLNGLVFELEGAYRWNHIAKIKNQGFDTQLHGRIHSAALLANIIYKFIWSYPIKPFYGFGVGWGYEQIHLSGPNLSGVKTHQSRAVYQLFGGIQACDFILQYNYVDFENNVKAHSLFLSFLKSF